MGRGVRGRGRRQNEDTQVKPQAMGLADHPSIPLR